MTVAFTFDTISYQAGSVVTAEIHGLTSPEYTSLIEDTDVDGITPGVEYTGYGLVRFNGESEEWEVVPADEIVETIDLYDDAGTVEGRIVKFRAPNYNGVYLYGYARMIYFAGLHPLPVVYDVPARSSIQINRGYSSVPTKTNVTYLIAGVVGVFFGAGLGLWVYSSRRRR